ncbi:MAG: hypothetical protein Q9213_001555 [Squamulea squamosa]
MVEVLNVVTLVVSRVHERVDLERSNEEVPSVGDSELESEDLVVDLVTGGAKDAEEVNGDPDGFSNEEGLDDTELDRGVFDPNGIDGEDFSVDGSELDRDGLRVDMVTGCPTDTEEAKVDPDELIETMYPSTIVNSITMS